MWTHMPSIINTKTFNMWSTHLYKISSNTSRLCQKFHHCNHIQQYIAASLRGIDIVHKHSFYTCDSWRYSPRNGSSVIRCGSVCPVERFLYQPFPTGEWMSGCATTDECQTTHWWCARLMCCCSEDWVGGNFSRSFEPFVEEFERNIVDLRVSFIARV